MPRCGNAGDENYFPPRERRCEKNGRRASLLASHRPMRLGGSLALPISAGFEFFTPSGSV